MNERNELPDALRDAVRVLRQEPAVPQGFTERVVSGIGNRVPGIGDRVSGIGYRAWLPIAAGLAGILVGGTSVYFAMSARTAAPVVATSPVPAVMPVRFTYQAPGASTVSIVGDFNQWNPQALPLRRSADGTMWEVEVTLQPGRYTYAFMVDGVLARDPSAPQVRDDFGATNSVVMVKGS
jgi:hypothetical protein